MHPFFVVKDQLPRSVKIYGFRKPNLSGNIFIYFARSVCLCPINVKTTEQIGPKFCVGHHMTIHGRLLKHQNWKKTVVENIFLKMCQLKKNSLNFKIIWNGRLSEQQFEAKIIDREGGAKRSKRQVILKTCCSKTQKLNVLG